MIFLSSRSYGIFTLETWIINGSLKQFLIDPKTGKEYPFKQRI